MRRTAIAFAAALALPWAAAPAAAQTRTAKLEVRQSPELGSHLTVRGRPVYLFTADRQGQGSAVATSRCDEKCLEIWPPVTTAGDPQAGSQVEDTKLDTIDQGGQQQVTYNGWPLYYFAKDTAPGTATGHDKRGFGGEWYLVTPDGRKAQAPAESERSTPTGRESGSPAAEPPGTE